MSCPYANALGIPGKGIHSTRILGMALNDWLMTIGLSAILSYFLNIHFLIVLIEVFILGEVLHYWFGLNTAFLKMIHLEPTC